MFILMQKILVAHAGSPQPSRWGEGTASNLECKLPGRMGEGEQGLPVASVSASLGRGIVKIYIGDNLVLLQLSLPKCL